jgi:hypothetical protein
MGPRRRATKACCRRVGARRLCPASDRRSRPSSGSEVLRDRDPSEHCADLLGLALTQTARRGELICEMAESTRAGYRVAGLNTLGSYVRRLASSRCSGKRSAPRREVNDLRKSGLLEGEFGFLSAREGFPDRECSRNRRLRDACSLGQRILGGGTQERPESLAKFPVVGSRVFEFPLRPNGKRIIVRGHGRQPTTRRALGGRAQRISSLAALLTPATAFARSTGSAT